MQNWRGWAMITVLIVTSVGVGIVAGRMVKIRPTSFPKMAPSSEEDRQRQKIEYALLTAGPLPAEKLKLHLKKASLGWIAHVEAESDDGKLATVLNDTRLLFLTLSNTGVPIQEAGVTHRTGALRDTYGKTIKDLIIARLRIQEPQWQRIDWSGFDPRNFSKIASEYWLHPILQQQPLPSPRPDNAEMMGKST